MFLSNCSSHSTSDRCKQCSPAQSRAMLMLQLLGAFSAAQFVLLNPAGPKWAAT